MKSLLEQIQELDNVIRQLHKIASRIRAGQNVDGWRECQGLIALIERNKQEILASESSRGKDDAE